MNKEESERAIKLLEKAIKEDYLKSSEVQEFYEMFKENKVGIFLATGELYSCNKRNAERLIRELSYTPINAKYEKSDRLDRWTKKLSFVAAVLVIPTALIELIGLIEGKELTQSTIEVATSIFELIQSLLDLLQ